MLIGRLAAELHCYIPEELDETWAQLRHLGRRRAQLITAATASVQRIGDFLSVTWPVVTEVCAQPFKSVTWLAALQVVTSRCGGDPARLGMKLGRSMPRSASLHSHTASSLSSLTTTESKCSHVLRDHGRCAGQGAGL